MTPLKIHNGGSYALIFDLLEMCDFSRRYGFVSIGQREQLAKYYC